MTQPDFLGRKVTCASCGVVYKAHPYISYTTSALTQEQRERAEKGKLNYFPCPKCGTENEATMDLPNWYKSFEDRRSDLTGAD